MSKTIKCKNCEKDSKYTINNCCINIADVYDKTDFKYIMSADGGSLFLCNECYNKVQELAKQILDIVKEEDIMIGDLLCGDK